MIKRCDIKTHLVLVKRHFCCNHTIMRNLMNDSENLTQWISSLFFFISDYLFYVFYLISGVLFQIQTIVVELVTARQNTVAMMPAGPTWGPATLWAPTSASTRLKVSRDAEQGPAEISAMAILKVKPSLRYVAPWLVMLWDGIDPSRIIWMVTAT